MNLNKSNWIWTAENYDKENASLIYFRKELTIENDVELSNIKISADSRYRFFVNGISVSQGPCKGDNQVWYYDEIEIGKFLHHGENVLAVIVLRYPENNDKGNRSVWRTGMPGLYLEGSIVYKDGNEFKFGADESWKSFYEDKIIIRKGQPVDRIFVSETAEGNVETFGWKKQNYNDENWGYAKEYNVFGIKKAVSPGGLSERPIPFMYETPLKFESIVCSRTEDTIESDWEKLILENKEITIPANKKVVIEISAGVEENGFIETAFVNGKGAEISILYSEAYVYDPKEDSPINIPSKGDRMDYINGYLDGFADKYIVGGFGTAELPEEYEPFWFRTFRFMQIAIETKDTPLEITKLSYRETGYPLDVKTKVSTSDESLNAIWDISERTLRRCMLETYVDCPFYEQLQYCMDARSQILFTYNVSADDRLARKCIDDFFRSQRYDGLINACYPSYGINVIPGFSIYYILMIHDHMMYFGDKKLVEKYLPLVQRTLQFFDNNLEENGLVSRTSEGGMGKYWTFVDWVEGWDIGVPSAIKKGPITMESLLYRMGLQAAAELSDFVGLKDLAEKYSNKSEEIKNAVLKSCIGKNGMVQDGPGIEEYSQHCQVFAVLTDTIEGKEATEIMEIAITDKNLGQCSVAMQYYLFRALEKVSLYSNTNELWNIWRKMIKNNLTTCVENDVDERSDCHAWGALALYELPAITLGVKPAEPGYKSIKINPVTGYLDWAKGEVITPKGIVKVAWNKENNGEVNIEVEVPEGVKYELIKG